MANKKSTSLTIPIKHIGNPKKIFLDSNMNPYTGEKLNGIGEQFDVFRNIYFGIIKQSDEAYRERILQEIENRRASNNE